jgi:hypothetical protein
MERIDPKKEATKQLLCGPGLDDFDLPEPQPCTDEVCEACQ